MSKFNIITRKMLAACTAERWKAQYYKHYGRRSVPYDEKWQWTDLAGNEKSEDIYNALIALGDNPDPDKVNEIIGNDSWTRVRCDNCEEMVESAVWVGNSDNDSAAKLCQKCARKAYKAIRKHNEAQHAN